MRLFGFDINIAPAKALARKSGTDPVAEWLRGGDVSAPLTNAYEQVVWVYRAVNALAEQVANIPFRFAYLGEGKPRISTGKLIDFYSRPAPNMNAFQYWELRVLWLMLRGECFRLPVYADTERRNLHSILFLDPSRMEHVIQDGNLIGWRYRSTGHSDQVKTQTFLPEEILHERLPNPFNHWRGLSPLSVATAASSSEHAASLFMKGLMENNGDAGMIVTVDDQLDADQREQISAQLRERRSLAGGASRPLLLWGGVQISHPQIAAADLNLIEHRRFSVAEICAAFGVPVEVLTSITYAKYDIMTVARINFIENRVVPLCRRLEAEEQTIVRSLNNKARGFFEVEEHPVLAAARRDRLKAAQAGFAMGIPLNELNRSLDLGISPQPWGNIGYVPNSMRPADQEPQS